MGDRPYLIFGGHWENLEGCEKWRQRMH